MEFCQFNPLENKGFADSFVGRAWYPYNVEHIYEKGEQAATRLELPTRLSYGYPSIELCACFLDFIWRPT